MRVLRYLPTNLSAPEIARELSVSVTTVRTHMRHLFAKLDVHRRTDAVTRARDLGLLAPSPRMPPRLVDEGGQAGYRPAGDERVHLTGAVTGHTFLEANPKAGSETGTGRIITVNLRADD
jgi:DNA-binding CsgD family transcriptional regulator